jgi:Domain of unknown function (DUF927)/RepB DNA-primase from phage plasmid
LFNPRRYFFFSNGGGLPSRRCHVLTSSNPDSGDATIKAIMAPEEEVRLALNPHLAQQFLEVLYSRYYSLTTGPAYLEVRGKREGASMSFRKFFENPEALLKDMPTWDPALNYWVGVAPRSNKESGRKEDCLVLTTIFGDVDCGTEGHKEVVQHQNKAEGLAAIKRFALKPTLVIDSGGGYQPYWVFREAIDLTNGNLEYIERINRGLAFALGGDVAATDAARILRLPGTYNMKLAGNPRPVEIVWCDPSQVYDLSELAKYEAKPQGAGMGKRQAHQGDSGAGSGGDYAPYAQKALADELAKLARTTTDRNIQLNLSAFALGQLVGAGVLERGSVQAALQGVAASIGLNGAEIRSTIRSGLESGMQQPRQLPEKQSKNVKRKQKKTVPKLIRDLDDREIIAIYEEETKLKLLTDPLQKDEAGSVQCSVLYNPEDPGRKAFINLGQGEHRGYYIEIKDGKAVNGGNLCKTIAEKGSGPYMFPKDVYKYLEKKLGHKRRPPKELAERGQAIPKECGYYYAVLKGCHNLVVIGESETQEKPLSNFVAQVTDEVTRDDGAKVTKEFTITGKAGDLQLPSAHVPTKDFDKLSWSREQWGAAASITPTRSNAVHLPNAILSYSREQGISTRTIYGHTGFRKINGVWRYLHGGGAIGGDDPIEVDLGENLQLYHLPDPGGIEAAHASLRFLEVAPWEITVPLISCAYLAPFADVCRIDFSVWLYGPTGSMKSTLAALALCHFGNFTRTTLPGSWFSTVNSLEQLCFKFKDCLLVIDDFMPASNSKESHRMTESAARLIYQAGNRSARGRLAADLSARPNYYPRCLIISTAEMLLPGQRQSATARYLGIELDPKKIQIDKNRLTEAQEEAGLYAAAMATYLEHLAPRLDDTVDEIKDLWAGYRKAFQKGAHLRIPEIQAWLAVGFEMFLRFQTRMGAINRDRTYEMEKQAWKVFEALGEKHARIIEGERPTLKFISVLRELFRQGRIYAEGANVPGAPYHGRELGWDGSEPARNAEFIGWANEDTLYLMPEATLRVVHEALRRQGDFLALGRNDMLSALARDGFIVPGKDGNTLVKKIQGTSKRVVCLPFKKLTYDEVEDGNL